MRKDEKKKKKKEKQKEKNKVQFYAVEQVGKYWKKKAEIRKCRNATK